MQPWFDYDQTAGLKPDPQNSRYTVWDCDGFPFVVRWSAATGDRLTRWTTQVRNFATLAEAVAAYKRPFRGIDVDLVKYNGGTPGRHLDTLARRKAGKPTKWHDSVPTEMR